MARPASWSRLGQNAEAGRFSCWATPISRAQEDGTISIYKISGMLTRPAGHEAEAEAQKFFEAEATMHEAEIEAEARKSEAEAE